MATRMKKARGDGKGSERISRDMLQTKTLSLKARGLLSLLKSLPDDWDCGGVAGISKTFCEKDGPHAVNEAIKELEEHGLFMRLKHQGDGGKWDWLWTFADYPDEVAAEVRRWEAKGFRSAGKGGNKKATAPSRKDEPALFEKLQHGAMTGEPAGGDPADGEPPNKESSPPKEESSTGQGGITHASRAASPPCVADAADKMDDKPLPVVKSADPVPPPPGQEPELPEGSGQMELVVKPGDGLPGHGPGQVQVDPFGGQEGLPDDVPLDGLKVPAAAKAVAKWGSGASPESLAVMRTYCAENPLPIRTQRRWLPEISSLLGQGFPDWAILVGLRVCFRGELGHTLLADKVAAAVAQRGSPGRGASTEDRFNQIDDVAARRMARAAAPGGSLVSSTPPAIEA